MVISIAVGTSFLVALDIVLTISVLLESYVSPFLLICSAGMLFSGGSLIYALVWSSIKEDRFNMAVLKTVGCTKKQVLSVFLLQGLALGFTGALVGVTFGYNLLVQYGAYHWYRRFWAEGRVYSPFSSLIFLGVICYALVISYLPASVGTKTSIRDLLSRQAPRKRVVLKNLELRNPLFGYSLRHILRNQRDYATLLASVALPMFVFVFSNIFYHSAALLQSLEGYVIARLALIAAFSSGAICILGFYSLWSDICRKRRAEFAVLKTLGFSRKQVLLSTVVESALLLGGSFVSAWVFSLAAIIVTPLPSGFPISVSAISSSLMFSMLVLLILLYIAVSEPIKAMQITVSKALDRIFIEEEW